MNDEAIHHVMIAMLRRREASGTKTKIIHDIQEFPYVHFVSELGLQDGELPILLIVEKGSIQCAVTTRNIYLLDRGKPEKISFFDIVDMRIQRIPHEPSTEVSRLIITLADKSQRTIHGEPGKPFYGLYELILNRVRAAKSKAPGQEES